MSAWLYSSELSIFVRGDFINLLMPSIHSNVFDYVVMLSMALVGTGIVYLFYVCANSH